MQLFQVLHYLRLDSSNIYFNVPLFGLVVNDQIQINSVDLSFVIGIVEIYVTNLLINSAM